MEQAVSFPNGALATLAQQGALLKRNLREPIPIESRRIALERMVTLEVPDLGYYLAEYSANISMTGMFINTQRVQPPGTRTTLSPNPAAKPLRSAIQPGAASKNRPKTSCSTISTPISENARICGAPTCPSRTQSR